MPERVGFPQGVITIAAPLDIIHVASTMPFMAAMTILEVVHVNASPNASYLAVRQRLCNETTRQFLFALGMLVFVLLVVLLAFKLLSIQA